VLATAAHAEPDRLAVYDNACDVFLSNHVANRASRVQGRAFLMTCARSFGDSCSRLEGLVGQLRAESLSGHHAPLFGAVLRLLGVSEDDMKRLYLHGMLRGLVSAAIRLGLVGPHEAQRLQRRLASVLDGLLSSCGGREPSCEELVQPAPLLDLLQGTHDRLYSRLFQS
jgi:urease accessory protein